MSQDTVQALIHRQVTAWKEDPRLTAGQLYLISPVDSKDVEVRAVGEAREVESSLLQGLIRRASQSNLGSFEDVREGERLLVYPLFQNGVLLGLWLLFPSDPYASLEAWSDSALRFSDELSGLMSAAQGEPPTFQEIVEAFPRFEDSASRREEKPHWEKSRSEAFTPTDLELSDGLLLDHRPIF